MPDELAALPHCWWHPGRSTGLSCTRCGRAACPDCLREAPVGYQCIDCVQAAQSMHGRTHPRQRTQHPGQRTITGALARQSALITPLLIAVNVLMFVITAVDARSVVDNGFSHLQQQGVLFPISIGLDGDWWRLLSSGFLHYGPIHLAVNMFSLWILGRDLELVLGRLRFLAVYLTALFGGSVSVYLFDDLTKQTAGASGAIYGLLGGLLVVVLRLRLNPAPAIGIIVLNIVISISLPNISLLGHLGGLIVGALATAVMVYVPIRGRAVWQGASIALIVLVFAFLVVLRDNQIAQLAAVITDQQLV